ncbi:DNA cytosine methyltransferase [Bilophila wadsworthia]|uniref:DNA cytosine methyltransferase n=1 Tax=Bilophila wadsworthia TaxID=35833 RepID=UPI0035206BC4
MKYLSLCSGIEAATVAWRPLGWTPVAFSEVERFPCAVLAHHYSDVPNVGDMTKINGRKYHGTVDLLVGGTPCQDFSVAGKRAGLSGERSRLALDFIRLAREIAPRWLLWENVPGCLSTNAGIDFGSFAQALADCGYHLAYRIMDAQFFGVPQRRRRVFLVGYFGDWRPPVAVLFEPHGLRRDTPPRRKTRKDVTQSLTRSLGTGGQDDNRAQGGFYVPDIVSQAMSCKWSKGTSGPAGDEHHNLICPPLTTRPYADNDAQQKKLVVSQYGDIAGALTRLHDSSPCAVALVAPTVGASGPPYSRTGNSRVESEALVLSGNCVRRLTPRECERLQGFPDDYTLIPGASDSARYKALGNSMAVPVMRWIGERIQKWEGRS